VLRERALAGDQVSLDALHPSALGHQAAAEALHEALRDGPAGTAQ
jgi:lysophospholipase L1-like esterase